MSDFKPVLNDSRSAKRLGKVVEVMTQKFIGKGKAHVDAFYGVETETECRISDLKAVLEELEASREMLHKLTLRASSPCTDSAAAVPFVKVPAALMEQARLLLFGKAEEKCTGCVLCTNGEVCQ